MLRDHGNVMEGRRRDREDARKEERRAIIEVGFVAICDVVRVVGERRRVECTRRCRNAVGSIVVVVEV